MDPIKVKNPCLLFDMSNLKSSYRELVQKYHPDKNAEVGAQENTTHITNCFDLLEKLTVPLPGLKQIRKLEIGTAYYYDDKIIYQTPGFEEYLAVYQRKFNFPNPEMAEEFKHANLDIVIEKDTITIKTLPGYVPLANVLEHHKEFTLEARHVAWMMSRLLNLVCFLHFNNISHNGITVDNCFADLANHSIFIYGGGWYNNAMGTAMKIISKEVYDNLPSKVKENTISTPQIDLTSVKELGKKMLGGGMDLLHSDKAPKPMLDWLFSPAEENAFSEFKVWEKVLMDSFGERKFVKIEIDPFDLWNN